MLEYPQRPSTAASTVLGKTSRHSSALPPKSESGLLPLARSQACQSALKNLRSKINNSKGHAGTLSRPRTSCFYRVNQRSAQAYSSYYLQSSHTSKWLSNRRVTHEEVLIPRAIDISALPSLEKTKFYSKPTLPNSRSQTNDVLESEDTNRSFFYNKKRRQADFEFMEQELLAQEEIYNNGKCSSKGTLTALRKTAQMITCSIPVAPVSNETTIDSLLLSASTSQARIELNDEKKTRYPYTEELIKSQPNESASFNASSPVHKLTHDQNGNDKAKDKHHTTFLTGISKPTVPLEGMSKSIWTYQQAASLARPIHVDTQQVYHLSNRNTQLSIKDPTLHITSSVNLGAGSYNLSFASLRPLSRSQLDVHIPSFSHTAHHVVRHTSRLKVAYNTNESNDNYPIGPSLKQNVDEAPLMQASPIPVTILDFFAS
ncbi:Hypothetical protein GLP15_1742 [Giardia lamblia P15]|uniref:Uncharacterized protein n=1 Tax=Giardia intestinalis (strain P15) TaxID=658858 RepID=E1F7B4_GIAIA|nr:Hypothetical protein GLP15_1742 [Giardia lamblia P15]